MDSNVSDTLIRQYIHTPALEFLCQRYDQSSVTKNSTGVKGSHAT